MSTPQQTTAQILQSGIATGMQRANTLLSPVFDALGNVLGWVASELPMTAGATTTIVNSAGAAIGTLVSADVNTVQSVQSTGAQIVGPVLDDARNVVGYIVPDLSWIETIGKYAVYAALGALGLFIAFELVKEVGD